MLDQNTGFFVIFSYDSIRIKTDFLSVMGYGLGGNLNFGITQRIFMAILAASFIVVMHALGNAMEC